MSVLAIDLGGTKLAAALVSDGLVEARAERAMRRDASTADWVDDIVALAAPWRARATRVAVAVTGIVRDGRWHALNPGTLPVEDGFALTAALERRFDLPVFALNDAQAAAWGEYRFGAGQGRDIVFLTVSTGIGGGLVLDGRLRLGACGVAGHVGQMPWFVVERDGDARTPIEDRVAGRWIAAAAQDAGHVTDAVGVFQAALSGEAWAVSIVARSAERLAHLCETLQAIVDPERIVIGGGVGLADGYLDRVRAALVPRSPLLLPTPIRAALGADAGLLGIADLALAEPR